MIDTLMAFWNQNRRKRAAQVLLTFLLMCISISLLFVAMSLPQWSRIQQQRETATGGAGRTSGAGKEDTPTNTGGSWATTPTVNVQSTTGPQATPTSPIIVPSQSTPTPTNSASPCSSPDAQAYGTATSASYGVTQATPLTVSQTTPTASTPRKLSPSPASTTPETHKRITPTPPPSPAASPSPEATPTALPTATPVQPTATGTSTITPTPTSITSATPAPTPTVISTDTPSRESPHVTRQRQSGGSPGGSATPISTGTSQPVDGNWVSACNGNDIGLAAGNEIVSFLWHNLWSIVAISLVSTMLFYAALWSTVVYRSRRHRQ